MVAGSGNVITTLRDRWSLEQEIQAMLDIRSEQEFSAEALRLAMSGEQVVPALLAQLDQADGRLVGVLGVLSSLYPDREEMVGQLTYAAHDRSRPDRGRVSAILILERFLEQATDPALLDTLDDPGFMANESIREMIRAGKQDPRAWIEYTRSLIEQPPETVWDVMETLLEIGGEQGVPALCLLAQEEAEGVSEAAIHTLGRLNHAAAAQGLASILSLLPPERRGLAQRSLLKLQLKGISAEERPDPRGRWRTLVGPVDGHGHQVVWFIHAPDERDRQKFLGLSLHEETGVQNAYGHHDIAPDMLPARRARGQVHSVLLPGDREVAHAGARLLMLETDFEYGRRLVREAQARTIASGEPFPIEYRLMGPWLWQYAEEERGGPVEVSLHPAPSTSLEASVGLLYHPAFRGWFAEGEALLKPAIALFKRWPEASTSVFGEMALPANEITDLTRRYYDRPTVERLQKRLMAMAEWLERAGETHRAGLAWASAHVLADTPPERHPLTRAMVELGIQMTVEQIRSLQ